MNKRPCILITNDDGIQAPGIKHLWNALSQYADLYVVAPEKEQSGVGVSITLRNDLYIKEISWEGPMGAWSISGTPADCVRMACSVLLPKPPDLIVSGINRGTNAGRTVLYSGTVGGVIEGILRGVPGIAFSSYDLEETEFQAFEQYIPLIVDYVLENPLPHGTLLNVSFPSTQVCLQKEGTLQIEGIKLARQGRRYWIEDPTKTASAGYSMGFKRVDCQEDCESDIAWLEKGYITCVPVHVDELTDIRYFNAHKERFLNK